MMTLSAERVRFHELLQVFRESIKPGGVVYDVGKSSLHDYSEFWKGYRYRTIDRDVSKNPDIVTDIEVPGNSFKIPIADGVVVHGVLEQCDDPVKLIKGVEMLLRRGGRAFFGLISVGYPLYKNDRIRMTPGGIEHYFKLFNIISQECFYPSEERLSYIFVTVEKKK